MPFNIAAYATLLEAPLLLLWVAKISVCSWCKSRDLCSVAYLPYAMEISSVHSQRLPLPLISDYCTGVVDIIVPPPSEPNTFQTLRESSTQTRHPHGP